jgi:hypothetical protein
MPSAVANRKAVQRLRNGLNLPRRWLGVVQTVNRDAQFLEHKGAMLSP